MTLTDLIGGGATAGMSYVAGSGLWSGSGSALTDAAGGDPAGITYDFNVTTPNTVRAVIGSVLPGQSGTLSFRLNINAGLPPGSATTQNTAYLCYNNGAVLVPLGCTGAPGNSQPTNTVAYTVLGSFAVRATDVSVTPAASSSTDDDALSNDIVTEASATQGSTVRFDNVIVNDGNGTDTFNITLPANTFPAGTSFQLFNSTDSAPLTDSNGDGVVDTGPVAVGAFTRVFVHAVLPPSATGGPFNVTKRATSAGGGAGVSDEVTDRLTAITASTVDLRNNSAVGPGAGPGPEGAAQVTNLTNPGTTTTFTLFVNNTGTSADNYDLAASTDSSFATITLPAGWSASFRQATGAVGSECSSTGAVITNTGSIAGGGSRAVCALVSVPAATSAGTTSIFYRARSPNTGATDRKHDAVTVNTVSQLTLTPNNVNQVSPGGNVVYQHTLDNNGSVAETAIAFPAASNTDSLSASGWNHVLYLDNGDGIFNPGPDTVITPGTTTIASLAAGAGVIIWDNVFAPLGAVVGTTNVTTIAVQSGSSAANASATDSTTVISSDLTLLKEQVRVDCTSGALIGSFVTTPLSGANAVPPGGCLKYRVTGTNSGTTALTSLSISDSTPGFTTLETTPAGCAVAATTTDTGAVTTGGTAADEGTGTVTATKASLAPLTNVVLTYCVQIDQ